MFKVRFVRSVCPLVVRDFYYKRHASVCSPSHLSLFHSLLLSSKAFLFSSHFSIPRLYKVRTSFYKVLIFLIPLPHFLMNVHSDINANFYVFFFKSITGYAHPSVYLDGKKKQNLRKTKDETKEKEMRIMLLL